MKKSFFAFIAMFAIMFMGCEVQMADYESGNNQKEDGYEGGNCLPGDICAEGLECNSDGICVKKTAATTDNTVADNDTAVTPDADNTAATLEQNECFGMVATYDVIPYKVVTFGTKSFQKDLYPESKVVIAGDDACSMIAYSQGGSIIAPIKCEGVHYTSSTQYETCTYSGALDLVDGSKGCNWNCVDYK